MDFLTSIPITIIASAFLAKALIGNAIVWLRVDISFSLLSIIFCNDLLGRLLESFKKTSKSS